MRSHEKRHEVKVLVFSHFSCIKLEKIEIICKFFATTIDFFNIIGYNHYVDMGVGYVN